MERYEKRRNELKDAFDYCAIMQTQDANLAIKQFGNLAYCAIE